MRDIYLRNIIFGILDSLVSTVGLLAGLSANGTPNQIIITTGIVYAFVEAFSMAVGSFIAEESVEFGTGASALGPLVGGVAMFISFVFAAFIPLIPYALFASSSALWYSIGISLVALFIAGLSLKLAVRGISRTQLMRHTLKVVLLGGAAIVLGVVIGVFLKAN